MWNIGSINPNRVLASYLFGTWSSAVLFGVITVQTHLYYKKYRNDALYTQLLVGLFWFMQLTEVSISSLGIYNTFTSTFGLLELLAQPWDRSYYGTHGVLAAVMVQAFFVVRYWSISHNILVTVSLVLLMTCALGLGLDITIRSYMTLESSFQTLYAVDEVLKVWLSFASATDILIAASLAFEMRKRHTGLSKTDTVLNRIALYGAATGAVTATVVTTQLLLFTVGGMFEPIIFFGMPLGGIYITTFLANLHTRSSLRVLASQPQGAIELSNMPTSHAQFQVTVMTAVSQSHHL